MTLNEFPFWKLADVSDNMLLGFMRRSLSRCYFAVVGILYFRSQLGHDRKISISLCRHN